KLSGARGPVTLVLPLRGVSALDAPGQPFHDPDADAALFDALRQNVESNVTLVELDHHINDPEFADALADHMLSLLAEQTHAVHRT
ncbi:MAG TPA: Tm-1-like ATP-binding domain-containing protein, partial [Longimicrobiales bacterium]|nr:Tm-1-like ATP-binding domain-containing protein [Longimicrobiales bacterium]